MSWIRSGKRGVVHIPHSRTSPVGAVVCNPNPRPLGPCPPQIVKLLCRFDASLLLRAVTVAILFWHMDIPRPTLMHSATVGSVWYLKGTRLAMHG